MSLIVDASVALKWYVDEPGSGQAMALLERDDLMAPAIITAEVGNAFWKRIRRKASTLEQAAAALQRLPHDFYVVEPIDQLSDEALRSSVELGHPIYDCFYLVLARREEAGLVTADRKLATLARSAEVRAELIEER